MAKILIVEDEEIIARGLADYLHFHKHKTHIEAEGHSALEAALKEDWDLILLDVMLPGLDGFQICEQIRASKGNQMILMLTAKGSEEDVLKGFESGADDYVCKPFSVALLMARVDSLLRRKNAGNKLTEENFIAGELDISVGLLKATYEKNSVDLTRRDLEILKLLSDNEGRIISRNQLLKDIWDYEKPEEVETRSVDMHIVKLRKKLSKLSKTKEFIETVRGEGYRL